MRQFWCFRRQKSDESNLLTSSGTGERHSGPRIRRDRKNAGHRVKDLCGATKQFDCSRQDLRNHMSVPEGQKVVPERGSRYDQEFFTASSWPGGGRGPCLFDSVLDTGSQIVVIWHDLAQAIGAHINTSRGVELEGANGVVSRTAR
jgi:hypothetical protein